MASQYVTEPEHVKHALKYMNIENKVEKDKVTVPQAHQLLATYEINRGLPDKIIPVEIRKKKDKKKAA